MSAVEADLVAADERLEGGATEEALALYEGALRSARDSAPEWIDDALLGRRECRARLGLQADADDEEALDLLRGPTPQSPVPAIPWFPPGEQRAAAQRWPETAEELADPALYARRVDQEARIVTEAQGRRPAIAPVAVGAFVAWAQEAGHDPDRRASLDAYAAALDPTIPWPPGRNDPCWCGSGRKHKRCCGR